MTGPGTQLQGIAAAAALFLLALAAQPAWADGPDTATLVITVEGLRSQDGQLLVLVFDDAEAFPGKDGRAAERRISPVDGERVTLRFDGLRRGTYAVTLVHDEDADLELDTNLLGIPKEGLGVSNNPPGAFPTFRDAAFDLDGERALTINLRYL